MKARRVLTLLLGVFALSWTFVPPPAAWVERVYSRGVYPAIASVLVPLADRLSVPLSLFLVGLLLVSVIALSLQLWRHPRRWRLWSERGLAGAVAVYTLFLLLWGANYGRVPVETLLGLATDPATEGEVEALARALLATVNETAPAPDARDFERALSSLRRSLEAEIRTLTGRAPTLPKRLKHLLPGSLLASGTLGIVSPFTLEAHVDGALPEPWRLAVGAHELAHVAGFAGEADADLVAALAGLKADDPYARYAVALWLFSRAARQLPQERLYDALAPSAAADLAALREVSGRYYRQLLGRVSYAVYDRYLVSRGVEGGVADYGRVVTLLVQAKRKGLVGQEAL